MTDDRFIARGLFVLFAVLLLTLNFVWGALSILDRSDQFPEQLAQVTIGLDTIVVLAVGALLGIRALNGGTSAK